MSAPPTCCLTPHIWDFHVHQLLTIWAISAQLMGFQEAKSIFCHILRQVSARVKVLSLSFPLIVMRMVSLAPSIYWTSPAFQKLLELGHMELPGFYGMGYQSLSHQSSAASLQKVWSPTKTEKERVQKVKYCLYPTSENFLFNTHSKNHMNNLNV